MLCLMAEPVPELPNKNKPPVRFSNTRVIIIKVVAATVFTIILGFAQGWAATRTYQPAQPAGFRMGLAHGMLMPAAFPGLVMGHDLPIYAANNQGRVYNLGYILGINTCGAIFFGICFWQPRRRQ